MRAIAMVPVLLVALAGCERGHPAAPASVDPTEAQRVAAFAFAKCLRDNGVPNFPDPVLDVKGNWSPPPGTVVPPEPPAACRDAAARLRSFENSKRVSDADLAKLRRFATCMRRQYPQFPDPDDRGAFRLPPSLVDTFDSRGRPDPAAPCLNEVPDGFRLQYVIPDP